MLMFMIMVLICVECC